MRSGRFSLSILTFKTRHSPVSTSESAFSYAVVLGASLGLLGSSFVAAEQRERLQGRAEHPSRSEYEYLICGGGVAAQEALNTFIEKKRASDLLLVAPEWRPCHVSSDTESVTNTELQNGIFSALVGKILSAFPTSKGPEIVIGPCVESIDTTRRVATLDNGDQVSFRRCLIAVGSEMPDIPLGKVVSADAAGLVSGAQSLSDWRRINDVFHDSGRTRNAVPDYRRHVTIVGGGWMSPIVGAAMIEHGADVTFSYSEPSFLARYLPRYVAQDVLARLHWLSDGGVDTLSYSAIRYVVARRALTDGIGGIEAEVHIGTVFDAFSIVDFRTDHVIFAPTLTSKIPIDAPNLIRGDAGFSVSPELAVASDIYVAGSAIDVTTPSKGLSDVIRWSSDHAISTGRHAAMNMMGGREPYSQAPGMTVDLSLLNLQIHVVGNASGSNETFGYFKRERQGGEHTCGGQLEIGTVIYVRPAPLSHRGATQKLLVTGVAIWEGSSHMKITDVAKAKSAAAALLSKNPMSRSSLEQTMDAFVTDCFGLTGYEEQAPRDSGGTEHGKKKRKEQIVNLEDNAHEQRHKNYEALTGSHSELLKHSKGVIWRRHKPARTVRIRDEELLWVENDKFGAVSSESKGDRVSRAYSDLLRRSAGQT
ncbi:Apoptosis-inducing factor 1, mitochondrial [Gracilariopsis chorda]|uniref:Apoptosis-inducing factor 1, mitochondrial n=1 Tax=Gracilariopsis chorda TaxID=448386 RepID=A0A2V3J5L4_9FLOR|nr:Apoptosis-inducing factor 1, mitochondrial [Gracilariopsis chorda]|eukprot:PXF49412.1 Apoptosis-inducing factor 1, mitochondrial [Gracilariopsis chorda]